MKKGKTDNKNKQQRLKIQDIKKNPSTDVGHVIYKIKAKELEYTIVSVIIILIFLSFSLFITFTSVQKVKKDNTLKSGTLITDYSDIDTGMGDIVTITNMTGISDKKGLKEKPYVFKITNNSKKTVNYQILLEDDVEMMDLDECSDLSLEKNNIHFSIDGNQIKSLADIYEDDVYILASGKIKPSEKKEYKLRIWPNDNVLDSSGHYHGKIVVKNME